MKLKTFIVMGVFVCVQLGCKHLLAIPFTRIGWEDLDGHYPKYGKRGCQYELTINDNVTAEVKL